MQNSYSSIWFATFLEEYSPERTATEVNFVLSQANLTQHRRILDVGCGMGRHLQVLANEFDVVGIDNSDYILEKARKKLPSVNFLHYDMRAIDKLEGDFDIILSLWQSFGYYSDFENVSILEQIYDKLTTGGRLIIDIYNREFFDNHQGTREIDRDGHKIIETTSLIGNRLSVELDYHQTNVQDSFNWQVYYPHEFIHLVENIGFVTNLVCCNFDPTQSITSDSPRVQYVLEK